jgi:3-hydroxybutyryl-CoA dehydrogenase
VAIVGAGTMGSGIAQVCATAGYKVQLMDASPEQTQRAVKLIEQSLKRFAEKERLSEEVSTILGRITTSQSMETFRDLDLVVEAVFEDLSLKADVFLQLEKFVPLHTILATNTSAISITEIASMMTSPWRMVGIHFFSPVPMIQVAEVIRGMETRDEILDEAIQFVKSLGKEPIVVNKDIPGFLLNRINLPSILEAIRLVEQGIGTIEDVDKGVKLAFGRPMGIFELGDLVGLDVTLNACKAIYEETKDAKYLPPVLLRRMVKVGRLGKKSRKGWYEYNPDGTRKKEKEKDR